MEHDENRTGVCGRKKLCNFKNDESNNLAYSLATKDQYWKWLLPR